MKCPKCGKEMEIIKENASFDTSRGNKEYVRTTYVCKDDDVWASVEVPKVI